MTPPVTTDATEEKQHHPQRRLLKKTLVILSLLFLAVVTLFFIWTARRYQQAMELARRAQEQYSTLNTRYPFTPPPAGQAVPAARWQALLRVREQIQKQMTPQLHQFLTTLLAADSLRDPALYHELIQGLPLLRPLLETQLNALGREQMGAREYQWMLGLGIVRVLETGKRGPNGEGAWRLLEQLERITHADTDRANDVDAQAVLEFLQKQYRGAGPPEPAALQALRGGDEAAGAIDLLLTMAQWAAPEGQNPEGLLKKLPARREES